MTPSGVSDSAQRQIEAGALREHGTEVYVVSVIDDGFGVVHAVFPSASWAVSYAHTCHLCLTEGEHLLIEGFAYGGGFDPTTVRVDRPDLVEPTVVELDKGDSG